MTSPAGRRPVGYRITDFRGAAAGGERAVATALWYPTDAEPREGLYAGGPNRGRVALDAPVLRGRHPLLVFSHGYGGTAVGSSYLAEALAARGWIVACPDHEDRDKVARLRGGRARVDRFEYLQRALAMARAGRDFDRGTVRYRLEDFRIALDGSIASPDLGPAVDVARVAAGGHSLGGATALSLAGPVERDPRIRGLLLLSPAIFMFSEEEFASVRVPTMTLLGEKERDEVRGRLSKAEHLALAFERFPPPKFLGEVRAGTHFSFNQPAASGIVARTWSGTEAEFDLIVSLAVPFLERHVAGRTGEEGALAGGDPRLSSWRGVPG